MSQFSKDFSGNGFPSSLFPEINNGDGIEDFLYLPEKNKEEKIVQEKTLDIPSHAGHVDRNPFKNIGHF